MLNQPLDDLGGVCFGAGADVVTEREGARALALSTGFRRGYSRFSSYLLALGAMLDTDALAKGGRAAARLAVLVYGATAALAAERVFVSSFYWSFGFHLTAAFGECLLCHDRVTQRRDHEGQPDRDPKRPLAYARGLGILRPTLLGAFQGGLGMGTRVRWMAEVTPVDLAIVYGAFCAGALPALAVAIYMWTKGL